MPRKLMTETMNRTNDDDDDGTTLPERVSERVRTGRRARVFISEGKEKWSIHLTHATKNHSRIQIMVVPRLDIGSIREIELYARSIRAIHAVTPRDRRVQ